MKSKLKMVRRRSPALRLEKLEDRWAMAGDVTAALSARGDLTIKGDIQENHIAIIDNGAGQITVQGSNSTSITANGSTDTQAVFNLSSSGLRNITINTGSAHTASGDVRGKFGADVVSLIGVELSGKLSIKGAHGGVVTVADANVKGSTSINFGTGVSSGSGVTAVGSVVSLGVGAGAENSLGVGLGNKQADVKIDVGGGHDEIHLGANVVGRHLSIKAKAGDDTIQLGVGGALAVGGKLSVDAGTGNDTVVMADLDITGKTSVSAGAGTDNVSIVATGAASAEYRGGLDVALSSGDDTLLLAKANVRGKAKIDGGAGADSLLVGSAGAATTFASDLAIYGRAGDDAIGLIATDVHGNLKIDAGAGSDSVLAADLDVLGNLYVAAGSGDDLVALGVAIGANHVGGNTTVELGAGNDRVSLKSATLDGNVKVNGSAGLDVIAASQTAIGGNVYVNGGSGVNSLLVDPATVQFAAGATVKTKAVVAVEGLALVQALAELDADVHAIALLDVYHDLFG